MLYNRLVCIVSTAYVAFTLHVSLAAAGTVIVSMGRDGKQMTVEATDATLLEVMQKIAQASGIQFDNPQSMSEGLRLNGTWTGSVETVLGRILRNTGHVLVRNSSMASGISRIMILEGRPELPKVADAEKPLDPRGAGTPQRAEQPSNARDANQPLQANASDIADKSTREVQSDLAADQTLAASGVVAARYGAAVARQFTGTEFGTPNIADGSAAPTDMATLTALVASDVKGLAASLKAVCIGSSCSRRR